MNIDRQPILQVAGRDVSGKVVYIDSVIIAESRVKSRTTYRMIESRVADSPIAIE